MSGQAENLADRRARVAASNRATGRVLSIVGVVLIALALALLIVGAVLISAGDSLELSGGDDDTIDGLRGGGAILSTVPPGILLLLSVCFLIPGEQLRRGWIGRNPAPPDTLLPQASNISRFRMLGAGWHLLWILVGLAVSLTLIGIPLLSWFTGAWPATLSEDSSFSGFWTIYGSIAFGVVIAAIASFIKKAGYRRAAADGRLTTEDPGGRAFWRWVDYRWRFDLWLAGIGGVLIALAPTFISGDVGPDGDPSALSADLVPVLLMGGAGLVLVVLGILASLQFWRSGEVLGSGESLA